MSMKNEIVIDDGGTAYPAAHDRSTTAGMTLRDWFAGQTLAAMEIDDYGSYELIAAAAYKTADAMIKERNRAEG